MNIKPERPKDEDCCGSGCNPCVFDVYEKQLALWESKTLTENSTQLLNPLKYSPFRVLEISNVAPDTNLYTFQAIDEKGSSIYSPIHLKMGDYAILKGTFRTENGVQENISRPYTLILNDCLKAGSFQVLIKLYANGKMSQYLSNIKPGDVLFWRGLYNHLSYKPTSQLLLVGAGTGIVPLHNIAKELVLDENCETWINIVGCFHSLSHVLLRDELNNLTNYWNCKVEYYISGDSTQAIRYREVVHFDKFNSSSLTQIMAKFKPSDVYVVVCGPDSFNKLSKELFIASGVSEKNLVIL